MADGEQCFILFYCFNDISMKLVVTHVIFDLVGAALLASTIDGWKVRI